MATTITNIRVDQRDMALLDRAPRSLWSDARRRLLRNKAAVAGVIYIAFLIAIAISAGLLAPHNPIEIFPGQSYRQAAWVQTNSSATTGTWTFPLGTDSIGRDVFSRLIYGTRTSLVVGFIPMTLTLLIGTLIGLVSGFKGGLTDGLLMRFADIIYSFPSLLFFIIVMAALKDTPIGRFMNGFLILFAALSLVGWVAVARLVRGQVLALKEKEFIAAGVGVGASDLRIMRRDILPNVLPTVVVFLPLMTALSMLTESALSFLSVGVQPPQASWGTIINDGLGLLYTRPAVTLAPGIAIALTAVVLNLFGDGVREALDPRARLRGAG